MLLGLSPGFQETAMQLLSNFLKQYSSLNVRLFLDPCIGKELEF